MEKRWLIHTPDPTLVSRIGRELGCHPVTATLLANRGIASAGAARGFLSPSVSDIRMPLSMVDMAAAVERIAAAIKDAEKILIFGDYDVDGVTATALLLEFLRTAGAEVDYYIPHRAEEGYGLKPFHILEVAAPRGVQVIITADCGSSGHEAAAAARRCGIDLVVTDHHEMSGPLPGALAVVNPKRDDCAAGFEHLAGVGVAFCLLICLRTHLRDAGHWRRQPEPNLKNACDLVALGTVADMVPLIGENRVFARAGLEVINNGQRAGLRALVTVSRIADRAVDGADIAFRLAPRINAAGRMAHARRAVELLTAADPTAAQAAAQELEQLNRRRQEIEKELLENIQESLGASPELVGRHSLVLAGADWHEGVIGIVASRLVKTHHRPVILTAVRDGLAKGSARGIEGLDLHELLSGCSNLLESYGGHAMAAGLALKPDNLERFRQRFDALAAAALSPEQRLPVLRVDCELALEDIDATLVDELEHLQPFGEANPEPLFMARNVRVRASSLVGGRHRRMDLSPTGGDRPVVIPAIQFNIDPQRPPAAIFERVAFRLRWNRWNGRKRIQIIVEET